MKIVSVENKNYSFENIFTKEKLEQLPARTVLGIDIGSRQGKAVLFHDKKIYLAIEPTGFSMQQTAENLKKDLISNAGISEEDIELDVCPWNLSLFQMICLQRYHATEWERLI